MNKPLQVTPIQTKIFRLGQNLHEFIVEELKSVEIKEGSILVITSKIVSLSESQTVSKKDVDKDALIISEADHDLGEVAFGCRLTIKHGLFIPSSGIDESNSESGDFILYPKDPFDSARSIHNYLSKTYKLTSLGILITDSHTLPLRQGVVGAALAYWGFQGVKNMIGQKDLFDRDLKMTKMDLADGLASSAVLMMGEANEACPLALIENAPVNFCSQTFPDEIQIPIEQDLYFPIYRDRLKIIRN